MGLDGPSRRIVVEPLEQPATEPREEPEPVREAPPVREPEKVPA